MTALLYILNVLQICSEDACNSSNTMCAKYIFHSQAGGSGFKSTNRHTHHLLFLLTCCLHFPIFLIICWPHAWTHAQTQIKIQDTNITNTLRAHTHTHGVFCKKLCSLKQDLVWCVTVMCNSQHMTAFQSNAMTYSPPIYNVDVMYQYYLTYACML